jgi:hypothetical protein
MYWAIQVIGDAAEGGAVGAKARAASRVQGHCLGHRHATGCSAKTADGRRATLVEIKEIKKQWEPEIAIENTRKDEETRKKIIK